jgi:hypothetical protein
MGNIENLALDGDSNGNWLAFDKNRHIVDNFEKEHTIADDH